MSCFDVKILDPDINTITIESCVGDQPASIEVITYDNTNILEINSCLNLGDIKVKDILAGSGINIVTSSGIYTVSLSDTYLTSSDIADFLESVQDIIGQSGLSAGNYVNLNYNDSTGLTTISVTGLQPSGNYSVVGHTHTSNQITDFNNAVSGLIPPSNFTSLSGISGVTVSNSGTNYTVSLTDPTIQLADITDLSSNARNFLLTPTSTNLRSLVTDETGLGSVVFSNSPILTGNPTVPTAPAGTNTAQIASTSFVRTEIINLIDTAPGALDTLNELAAALGDDANFATTITNSLANKAALSGAVFTGSVTIPSGTGNFNSLTVNGTGVSLQGHTHTSSNITDFNSSVSGLLPSVSGSGYVNTSFNNNIYTISVSGLQPSGSYASGVHSHGNITSSGTIGSTSGLLVITENSGILTTTSGISSSYITNFNSSVSGLLPTINNSGDNRLLTSNGTATGIDAESNLTFDNEILSISGAFPILKMGDVWTINGNPISIPSLELNGAGSVIFLNAYHSNTIDSSGGDVTITADSGIYLYLYNSNQLYINNSGLYYNNTPISISGHTHTSSNITDFNSSVSGLLPVKNLTAGSGIGISSLSGDFTISVTGTFGLTSEEVDDRVSNLLVAGSYISLNYDDNLNSLTIGATGLQPSGNYSVVGHTHLSNDITDFNSSVSGLIPVKNIVPGTSVNISSVSGEYTISVTGVAASSASSLITSCHNLTGSTISKMSVVYINGGHGNEPTITLAIASSESTSSKTFGVTMEDIPFNQSGDVVVVGALIDVNTNQFSAVEGTTLYLSPSVSGALTTTKPLAPNHLVTVGKIVRNHTNQGIIQVSIQNGFELGELHNVSTNGSGDNGKFLQYNSGSGLWVSSSSGNFTTLQLNGTNVSVSGHTHTSSDITNFNSAVSGLIGIQTLTGLSGIQIASSGTNRQISTNLIPGNGIALTYNNDNSLTINTITNNGRILISDNVTTNLTIPSGYIPGSLSIYQNGVKLLDTIDYTATNGSGIVFTTSPTSGTYIEYQTPTNTNNIQGLINNTLDNNIIAGSGIILNYDNLSNNLTISVSGDIGGGAAAKEVRVDSSAITTIYVGQAPVGTLNSDPGWSIIRDTFNSLGVYQATAYATGIWNNRTSLIYS